MPSDVEQGANPGVEPETQASGTESENRASLDARATENTEQARETLGMPGGPPWGGGWRERHQDYTFTRDVCNVVLLGLLASFICIFTWAWVDAFQKANYDQAVGLMLILFFGTIVCTCGFRRRVAALSQLEEERTQAQADQLDQIGEVMRGPKGVPLHIRKNFHYFIFEESATMNEDMKESPPTPPTISSFPAGASGKGRGQSSGGPPRRAVGTLHDGEGGVSESAPGITHSSAAASTAAVDEDGGDNGDPTTDPEDDRTDVEGAPSAREASYAHRSGISGHETVSADSDGRFSADREEDSSDREGASTDHDDVSTLSAASRDSRSRDGPEAEVEAEADASTNTNETYEPVIVVDESEGGQGASRETPGDWERRQQYVGGEEIRPRSAEEPYQAQEGLQAEPQPSHRSEQEGEAIPVFAWASTTLTDCSVCLEAYKAGDRVCRLPCAHAFHASCIDTWLDQQHVCPQCRFNLLPERRPVMPPARPHDIMPGDESSMSSLFSSPIDGMSTLPAHGASASGLTVPYRTFPDTPQAGSLSPMASTAAMQSFRRSPGFTPRASGRMRGTPVSSNATIGTPRFSVFSSATSALALPGAETPSTDGRPRSINASYGSALSRPRPMTPRDPGGHQHQPHVQLPLRLQQLRRQQPSDTQQETIHGQISGQTPRHQAATVGQVHSQLQAQQHPHHPRQRQVNPPQHTRHGTLSSSSVVSSTPGYAIPTSGGVIGGGLANGTNASLGSHPANTVVDGNGGSGHNLNILSNGSIGLGVGSGQGQRRLRLPSLGRRPRSASCDVITSPGLCVIGSSGSSSPKTGRGGERIGAPSSRGTPRFRGGGQFKGFPALQVRMASWDEGDDFAGSVESSERSCVRGRRSSDDWGTRDWGRGLRSSAAMGRSRTESAADSQRGDDGERGPAVVRVWPGGSPPSFEEGDDNELRFVEEDMEILSTMSASTSEHEFFARTMLYC